MNEMFIASFLRAWQEFRCFAYITPFNPQDSSVGLVWLITTDCPLHLEIQLNIYHVIKDIFDLQNNRVIFFSVL